MTPKILIEEEVYRKVLFWVHKSHQEVSGLGTVRVEENGVLRVVSAMLLPQKNGATHTDIEAEEVNKALFELRDAEGDLRWWWHSHVNMGVFWSGTDMDTIKKIGAGGWFACSVFNKKDEVKSAFYSVDGQKTPWGTQPLFLDDLKTEYTLENPNEAEWEAEYKKNVTDMIPKQYPTQRTWGLEDNGWVKDKTGVWVRKTSGPTTTPTTPVGTVKFNPLNQPPEVRPPHMPKRVYKAWKKAWRENQGIQVNHRTYDDVDVEEDDRLVDDYGLTQEERAMLARCGWDQQDIDTLVEENFSPSEIILLADYHVTAQEVVTLMSQGFDAEDIMDFVKRTEADEIPVADRRHS